MSILIVEDDDSVARFLRQATAEAGYDPLVIPDGVNALDAARSGKFDLVLLDVMLPGMNGFEVCRRLRASGVRTPVLIITARDTLEDKVEGLDAGADDYIVKPFQVAELLARARALLRRANLTSDVLSVEDVTLDTGTRQAIRSGKHVSLSSTEFSLLEYLMRNVGRVVTRATILEAVWHYDFGGNDNVLDVYISYLRHKLDTERETSIIHTVRGVGYRMGEENAS
jgi:DNA-binding response OmpR family regulator